MMTATLGLATSLPASDFLDFDGEVNTPIHPDAYQMTEADEVAETAYLIGLSGDFVSFGEAFPGRHHLASAFHDGLRLGRVERARREGFEAGLSWLTHKPACSDPTNPQCVAFCQGAIAGQAQLASDRDEALTEFDAEADAIEWERDARHHNAEVENWHPAEVAEYGMGSRLIPVAH